jgi:hypothetical protein
MHVSVWSGSARVVPLALLLGPGALRPASAATIVVPAGGNLQTLNSAWSEVTNCLIDEIHSTIQESHGIGGWNGPGPFNVVNKRIESAGENIIFGGAASSVTDAQITPSDIMVRENYLLKPLAWKSPRRETRWSG